jgi:DUF309 family protein family protein
MRRSVRNRLAELLLRAFEDPGKADVIRWLGLFCDLAARGGRPELPMTDLLGVGSGTFPGQENGGRELLAWLIGLEPLAEPDLTDICGRVRAYTDVLDSLHEMDPWLRGLNPLRRVLAQAAACFNAGLFFEAHEHLEQVWRSQPRGQTRKFLQGLIQISVGYHHAQRGSFDGAVNQLGKGLDKAAGSTGEVLGLDGDAFFPAVTRTRDAIVAGGRGGMRPMPLAEIPCMPLLGVNSSRCDRGSSNPPTEEKVMTAKSPFMEPDP